MPESMGTKEFGNRVKRIQILEDGRVPAKEAKNWIIEGEKKGITRKEYKRLLNNFERHMELGKRKMKERGELPNVEGDVVRGKKAMHEEDFGSNWQREDERGGRGDEKQTLSGKKKKTVKEENRRGERRERHGDW